MKRKFTFLIAAALMLLTMMATTGTMWGQAAVNTTLWEETWTGGDANETPSAYGFEGTTVYGNATLSYAQSSTNTKLYAEALAGGTSPELLLSKSNQTWTISNIPTGQATEMSLTFLSNKTTFDVTSTTTGITISGSEKSWTISANNVTSFNLTIKNTGSSNARVDNILLKVTTAGGGSGDLKDSDLAITGTPVALNFDLYNNSSAQVIHYTTSSTGAVTVSASDYVTTSVNETAKTITVTPTAVTPSPQTITVSQTADATYSAGSVTFTVTITNTPPAFTVTLGDDSSTLTEASSGAGVTLPTRSSLNGYDFAGWSETNVNPETTTAPTIIAAGEYHPTANITLYPVYSKTIGGGGSQNANASVTIADYATAHNWGSSSSTNQKSITLNSDVTATCNSGTNSGKYYNDGWRIYQTETGKITITTTNGTLTSVTFTFTVSNTGTLNYNSSAITSGTAVNVSGTSAEFTVGNSGSATNGQVRITAISVNYTIQGSGTTYYWSYPVAATVETPAIVIAENPFYFSTTATITCATEGAAIKYSFDGANWSSYSAALTITETKTIYAKANKNDNESSVASVTATKNLAEPIVTINATGITNTDVFTGTAAGSLSASVTYNEVAIEGATVTWSGDADAVATIDASTGAVILVAAGSVTFTATYAGNGDYSEKTATYQMTVTNTDPNIPGSQNNPYTVAQARAAIDAGIGVTGVYATGIVSEIVTEYSTQWSNITFDIVDESGDAVSLRAYRCGGDDAANVQVNDIAVIYGNLTQYGEIYEFAQGCQVVSLEHPIVTEPTITVTPATVNVSAEGEEGTLSVTYDNINEVVAEVYFCDAQGGTATYDWITAEINSDKNVYYIIYANDGEARTAYLKVYALDDNAENVYSNLVTINQDEYVAPTYATLPFAFNGGKADIENTDGLTQEGLGSDYNATSNPTTKLKFDGSGDWLLLQFSERPGTLTFDIKGNSFSGSTFKVQTSEDGITYTDLETYTELGDTQDESFDNLDENVRYIKWIYTEKVNGNVGLGNIALAEYVAPVASITVDPTLVEVDAAEHEGYIGIAYQNLTINQASDFGIQFYDSEDHELNGNAEPDWVTAEPTTQSGEEGYFVYYLIEENDDEARTAYFKVWALDDTEPVYSNLVTVSQAAPVVLPPVINAEDIEIAYDATSGVIDYTIDNPDTGVSLSANSDDDWISDITISESQVSFTTTVNEGNTDRIGTITLSYTGAEDKAVTVTQGHHVVDYATLPFEWEGGPRSEFEALNGTSTYSVGDYGDNQGVYRMKLDGTDDYIQVKTNEQPGIVTIGVKMIGGATTSTLTVQGSADGTTFTNVEALTISGSQNDELTLTTTNDFVATDRYVRLLFTKGSNVGVGPITITKFTTDPVIVAEDTEIACDATAGEIVYFITNPVDGGVLTANTTAEWLTIGTVGETVPFICEANTEATAREATVTLTYTYGDSQTVTKDVTVTQAAYIIDYAEMPFDFDGGRADIETTNGLTQSGLDTDYGSSPKLKFKTQGTTVTLKLNAAPVSLSYDIKGNSFSDGQFDVEYSADGETYTNLVSYTELGNTQYVLHTDFDSNVRYIRWIYTTKVNGNVALGNIHATEHYDTYGDVIFDNLDLTASSESLIIHEGSVVTVTGTLINNSPDNLIIQDGGQLIHESDVAATVQKNITAYTAKDGDGWYLIATPVETIDKSVVAGTTYDLFLYSEPDAMWYAHWDNPGFQTLNRGQGYLYANAENKTINYEGLMKATNSNINIPLNYTSTLSDAVRGFNLVGNPFTRNLVLGDMKLGGANLTTYYVTNTDRTALQAITSDAYQIKPGEGFFVQATPASQQLSFNVSSKDDIDFRYIKIVAGNENGYDNAYIQMGDCNTLRKMNIANKTEVYVMDGEDDYAAARVEELEGSMPVHFKAIADGEYTITIEAKYTDVYYMHLFDNFTGEDIDLMLEPSYTFHAAAEDAENRFLLVFDFNNHLSVNENYTNDVFAYQYGDEIIINGEGELQIFDVMGRMVLNTKVNGVQSFNVPSNGVYILRIIGNDIKTQKIVVK